GRHPDADSVRSRRAVDRRPTAQRGARQRSIGAWQRQARRHGASVASALVREESPTSVRAFYDALAPWYHLIYEDWDASVARQGAALASRSRGHWGASASRVLDAAVGIGTQALGLAARGVRVLGSDVSPAAVHRARSEARRRGLLLPCHVADFRALAVRSASVDVALVADNSLPHLQNEDDVGNALAEWHRCARPGGGCLISMRDYGAPPAAGTVEIHPYGERVWQGRRYRLARCGPGRGSATSLRSRLPTQTMPPSRSQC